MHPLPQPKDWDPRLAHTWDNFDSFMRLAATETLKSHDTPAVYYAKAVQCLKVSNYHAAYSHVDTAMRIEADPRWLVFRHKRNDDFTGYDGLTVGTYKAQLKLIHPLNIPVERRLVEDAARKGADRYNQEKAA